MQMAEPANAKLTPGLAAAPGSESLALQGVVKLNARLPIMATFLEALTLPYKHYRALPKVGLPLIVTLGMGESLFYFFPDTEGGYLELAFFGLIGIALLLSLVMAIVGCHRIFLLGDSVAEKSRLLNWTGSAINYAGWCIYIWLCVIFAFLTFFPFVIVCMWLWESARHFFDNYPTFLSAIGAVVVVVGSALFGVLYLYVISRWSLVLPSSAMGIHGKSLAWSWRLSSGSGWRLTLLIGFLPLALGSILGLLPEADSTAIFLLYVALWLVVGVIEVGLLSLSYRFLVSHETSGNATE